MDGQIKVEWTHALRSALRQARKMSLITEKGVMMRFRSPSDPRGKRRVSE